MPEFYTAATEPDHDELYRAGIDPEKLEFMTGEERRKILRAADLNPEEYDF